MLSGGLRLLTCKAVMATKHVTGMPNREVEVLPPLNDNKEDTLPPLHYNTVKGDLEDRQNVYHYKVEMRPISP